MIVGAAKSGTTALFSYLDQHPSIFMTNPKEPHYFRSAEDQNWHSKGRAMTEQSTDSQ